MLVRSYRTVSPLPPEVAVCFLWHFPASHLGLPLAITLLCEVRTFLERHSRRPRPPGQLVRPYIIFFHDAGSSSPLSTAGQGSGRFALCRTDLRGGSGGRGGAVAGPFQPDVHPHFRGVAAGLPSDQAVGAGRV